MRSSIASHVADRIRFIEMSTGRKPESLGLPKDLLDALEAEIEPLLAVREPQTMPEARFRCQYLGVYFYEEE